MASKIVDCSVQPLDVSFHPKNPGILAAGLVDGTIEVHNLPEDQNGTGDSECKEDDESENDTILSSIPIENLTIGNHETKKVSSCRTSRFSRSGEHILCSTGKDICALDTEKSCSLGADENSILWRISDAMESPIHAIHQLPPESPAGSLLCVGDEIGSIKLFDHRQCGGIKGMKQACVQSWQKNEDYISGFENDLKGTTLLAASADGTLSSIDIRMATSSEKTGKNKTPIRVSDNQDDELLSIQLLKNGRKVICGTHQGVLAVWSWGTWGDVSDRFPGHPSSIDALLKLDEDTLLTGSSDGVIRLVQIQPDKFLGILGQHDHGYPIEKLQFNANKSYVGSVSHDNLIRLWDMDILRDDDSDDDDESNDDTEESNLKIGAAIQTSTFKHDSDDDWTDEEGDILAVNNNSEDSSDSDEEDEQKGTLNDRRKKRLKTENEKFFSDL